MGCASARVMAEVVAKDARATCMFACRLASRSAPAVAMLLLLESLAPANSSSLVHIDAEASCRQGSSITNIRERLNLDGRRLPPDEAAASSSLASSSTSSNGRAESARRFSAVRYNSSAAITPHGRERRERRAAWVPGIAK
eukprot:3752730-Prymnesium_polylepis.1